MTSSALFPGKQRYRAFCQCLFEYDGDKTNSAIAYWAAQSEMKKHIFSSWSGFGQFRVLMLLADLPEITFFW